MYEVKIIKHSISEAGKEIITFECTYPRYIHAEVMTHRRLSRNSSSSRAIPVEKMIQDVKENPVGFIFWGKNKRGMSAKEELSGFKLDLAKFIWNGMAKLSCYAATLLTKIGLHKQNVNRMLEPYSRIKVVMTGTDWNNFFHLRDHKDAQPEIRHLAVLMNNLKKKSVPQLLQKGQWHLPYVDSKDEKHLKLSTSLCAQVSFRTLDDDCGKTERIWNTLVVNEPVHASPTEHQATPLEDPTEPNGNFFGWLQHRSLIKNNVKLG